MERLQLIHLFVTEELLEKVENLLLSGLEICDVISNLDVLLDQNKTNFGLLSLLAFLSCSFQENNEANRYLDSLISSYSKQVISLEDGCYETVDSIRIAICLVSEVSNNYFNEYVNLNKFARLLIANNFKAHLLINESMPIEIAMSLLESLFNFVINKNSKMSNNFDYDVLLNSFFRIRAIYCKNCHFGKYIYPTCALYYWFLKGAEKQETGFSSYAYIFRLLEPTLEDKALKYIKPFLENKDSSDLFIKNVCSRIENERAFYSGCGNSLKVTKSFLFKMLRFALANYSIEEIYSDRSITANYIVSLREEESTNKKIKTQLTNAFVKEIEKKEERVTCNCNIF